MSRLLIIGIVLLSACPAMAQWTCDADYRDDGVCDCGCGELDGDCVTADAINCEQDNCSEFETPGYTDNFNCYLLGDDPGLVGWTCLAYYYGDNGCDCGCGIKDMDCAGNDLTIAVCEYDVCPDGQSPGLLDHRICYNYGDDPDIETGWVCASYYWVDNQCDCGCGLFDDTCDDSSAASCYQDFCAADEVVSDSNNAVCESILDDTDDSDTNIEDTDTTIIDSDSVLTDSDSDTLDGSDADSDTGRDIIDRDLPPVVEPETTGSDNSNGSGCSITMRSSTLSLFQILFR